MSLFISALLLVALIAAAATDLRERLIYNIVPICVLALFALTVLATPINTQSLFSHLASFAIAAIAGIALFSARLMGGGDIKLYAALALHYPLSQLLDLTLAIVVSGGALGLGFAVFSYFKTRQTSVLPADQPEAAAPSFRNALKTPIPYGCAILAGHIWIQATLGTAPSI